MQHQPKRRGFTILELVAIIVSFVVGFVVAMPTLEGNRDTARQLKDSTQIRGIVQACAIWAQYNDERYPTPSRVDRNGSTLPRPDGLTGPDLRLDTTGNTLSMLMWNGFFPVELAVSPAEVGNVQVMADFMSVNPPTAVRPRDAFWDPAFRGTPLDEWGGKVPGAVGDAGHNSYAQVAYYGGRARLWSNTFSSVEACWGNRGPAYTLGDGGWVPLEGNQFGDGSTTMRIHGEPTTWEGNIGFNDQHVEYLTRPDPDSLRWRFPAPEGRGNLPANDNVFHAEHDRTRAPIDEHIKPVQGADGRGTIRGTMAEGGDGALDQRDNYLRPIARVVPGKNGRITAEFWID